MNLVLTTLTPFVVPSVATLALIVSIASFVTARSSLKVAQATYDRAGARIIAWCEIGKFVQQADQAIYLYIVVRNAGLAAIDVERFELAGVSRNSTALWGTLPPEHLSRGADLPFKLQPQSAAVWEYRFTQDSWQRRMRLVPSSSTILPRLKSRYKLFVNFGDGSSEEYETDGKILEYLTNKDDVWDQARFRSAYRRRRR